MNIARLRERGWKDREIAQAQKIFARAEAHVPPSLRRWEHATAFLLSCIVAAGGVGLLLWLLPILMVVHPAVRIPLAFLVGAGEGLLALGAWRDARHHPHHVTAAVVVIVVGASLVGISALGVRAGIESALALAAGVAVPYVTWRMHGSR